MINRNKNQKGFTLIEILVVIAIIALLASIISASLGSARALSRNARRKSDLNQLQTALEIYHEDNGHYPVTGVGVWYASEIGDYDPNNGGDWIPGLAPAYIPTLPQDPRGGPSIINPPCGSPWKASYQYHSDSGANYTLLSHCAPEGAMSANDPFYDPLRVSWAWKICSSKQGVDCR